MGYQLSLPMLLRALKLRCDYPHKLTLPFKSKASYDLQNPPALAFLISTFMGSQNLKFERGTKKEEQFLVVADQCRSPENFSLGRPNQMLTFEFGGWGVNRNTHVKTFRSRIESKQKVWRQVRLGTRAILMEGKFYNPEPFRVWDSTSRERFGFSLNHKSVFHSKNSSFKETRLSLYLFVPFFHFLLSSNEFFFHLRYGRL